MRQLQKKAKKRTRTKPREPLAEGVIPLTKDGRRSWASMSDEELVAYAKRFIKENGVRGRTEVEKADPGLYTVLLRRKLLDEIGLDDKRRNWASMSDDELVSHAKRFMKEKGIGGRTELSRADSGLYTVLLRRKLLDEMGLDDKHRNWASMSDDELVFYTKRVMKEKRLCRRTELYNADSGLYFILTKRKLSDKVGFEENQRRRRRWNSMSDGEIVDHAKRFIKKDKISKRSELQKADSGLHEALRKRKLLDKVGLEGKQRDWASMSDEEIVAFAKAFVKEKEISRRWDLGKTNKWLYDILHRRKLLDHVFEDIEQTREREGIQQIVVALSEF